MPTTNQNGSDGGAQASDERTVYVTAGGARWHNSRRCAGNLSRVHEIALSEVYGSWEPCGNCAQAEG